MKPLAQPTIKELWENGQAAFSYMRGPGHSGSFYSMVEGNQFDWEADGSVLVIYESALYSGGYFGIHVADGYEIDLRLNFNKNLAWGIRGIEEYDAFWDSNEDDLIDESRVQYDRPSLSTSRTLDFQLEGGDEIEIDIDDDLSGSFGNFYFKIGSKKFRLEEGLTENAAVDTDVRISLTSITPNPIPPGSPGGPEITPEPSPGDDDTSEPQPATHDPLGYPYDQAIKSWSGFGFSFELWPYNKGYYIIEWKPEAANDDFDLWYSKRSPWAGVYPWISSQDAFNKADLKWAELQEKARIWYDWDIVIFDRTFQNGSVDNPGTVGAIYGGMFRVQVVKNLAGQFVVRVAWREFQEAETTGIWDDWEEIQFYGPYDSYSEAEAILDQVLDLIGNPIYPDPEQEEEVQEEENEKVDPIDDPIAICSIEYDPIITSANTTNHQASVGISKCTYNLNNTNPIYVGSYYRAIEIGSGNVIATTELNRSTYPDLESQKQAMIQAAETWIAGWNETYPPEVFMWIQDEILGEVPGTAYWARFYEYEQTYDRTTGRSQYQVFRYTIAGYEQYFVSDSRDEALAAYEALVSGNITVENPGLYALLALSLIAGIGVLAFKYRRSGGGSV